MADTDGSIRFGVHMDSEKVKKELATLRNQLVSQTRQVDNQAKAVNRLQAQYDKLMSNSKIPQGASKLVEDLAAAQAEAARIDAQIQEIQRTSAAGEGAGEEDPKIADLQAKLAAADEKAGLLDEKLRQLGISPDVVEKALGLQQQIGAANSELERMGQDADNTAERIAMLEDRTTSWPVKLSGLVSRMGKTIVNAGGKAASAIGTLRDKIKGLGREKGFEKASKGAGKFANRLKRIVTGALFFNLISRGLTALTKKMGEYLTANREFAKALEGVKSNLLTAFQPVYDAVMPALTKLMEALETVTAKFAAFMATIFGTTAKQAQENAKALNEQADATEEVGKETKKASKFLASFDTIEKVGTEDAGGGEGNETGSGGTPGFDTDFSDIEPPKWLTDFWKVFQDGWAQYGQTTVDAFKAAWGAIKDLISAVGAAFMAAWTGGDGLEVLSDLNALLRTVLGIIRDIAVAFKTAWQNGGGEAVISALSFALDSVLKLLISIGQSFRNAWNDGIGVQICETILSIITHIFEIVGNLATRLREAWEENDNGKAIWAAILNAVEVVLSTVDSLAESTANWAAKLDFGPLLSSVRGLFEAFLPVLEQIGAILTTIWDNILLPSVGWLIETGLPAVVDFFASLLEGLQKYPEILETLTDLVVAFIAAWAIGKVVSGVTALVQSMNPLVAILGSALILFTAIAGAWDDMSGLQKAIAVIGALIAVAAVAAIAVGALQSALTLGIAAAAIVAGIVAVTAAISSATNKAKSEGSRYSAAAGSMGGGPYSARNIGGYDLTQYPHLASGAVISPNSEFLAVLGDQKHGRNLEAPEGLIRQIMREELGNMAGGLGQTNVNVEFTGSLAQLARVLQPHITTETARLGPQLISGGGLA